MAARTRHAAINPPAYRIASHLLCSAPARELEVRRSHESPSRAAATVQRNGPQLPSQRTYTT